MHVQLTFVHCIVFLLYRTGLEWWEGRTRMLREGSKYLEGLEACGLFALGHEDGVGVLVMPVSHM